MQLKTLYKCATKIRPFSFVAPSERETAGLDGTDVPTPTAEVEGGGGGGCVAVWLLLFLSEISGQRFGIRNKRHIITTDNSLLKYKNMPILGISFVKYPRKNMQLRHYTHTHTRIRKD